MEKFRILLFFIALLLCSCSGKQGEIVVTVLKCEYLVNPLGIDNLKPGFSWTLISEERDQKQSACEIIVSDNIRDIERLNGNVWETGKITTSQSLHLVYDGLPLKSFQRYYWRVKVYDQNDLPSSWSNPAWFETAMLSDTDWQAKWIGDGRSQFTKDEDFYGNDPMPLFRKLFISKKKVISARLYISELGYYEAYLNGQKIGDRLLDPGWTNYEKQVPCTVYDISDQLRRGTNAIGIMSGNGWYNVLPLRMWGHLNLRNALETGRPCVKAQIRIAYSDGSVNTIATDETWQTLPGPVLRNSVYLGEHYDARLERDEWAMPVRLEGLKNAVVTQGPPGRLTPQMQPPVRITSVLRPIKITEPQPGVFIADMGQNFAGVARIKVQGKPGTTVVLRYGEDICPDGNINVMTSVAGQIKNNNGGPGAPPVAWQEDRYTLKGKGVEIWSPRFTFHGFRYVEVTGWPGKLTVDEIEGLRMHSDVEITGSFTCSNDLLNKLHEVTRRTFLSNLFSVQSDCPAREKFGYGGDMVATAEAFLYQFDMANFYRKTIRDFAESQRPRGGMTETAPYVGIADSGPGDGSGPLGWQLAFPYLIKQIYDFYGDRRIIEDNYQTLVKQVEFLQSKAEENLYDRGLSDHESLDPKPVAFTSSAFYYHHIRLLADFAATLGKQADFQRYSQLADTVKEAIIQKFQVSGTGRFDMATQAAQIVALWYDLVPENKKKEAFDVLLGEINRHQGHLSTGIFATKMIFDVLRENDRSDIAYDIVNRRDFPGWGYMLEKGATTLWETWAYSDNIYSHNHPMFGSVSEWFYRSLLGINAGEPGFGKIIVKPQPVAGLTFAGGSYHSIRGPITCNWQNDNQRFRLDVGIPVNTTAEIWIPAKDVETVTEGKKPIQQVNDIRYIRSENDFVILETGSGKYSFEASNQKTQGKDN
ncbi:MAG: family 78 glycoside hydrolase catalytic domain [Mangrovibacterium sp.]